jgi:phosphate transport system protein
MNDQHIVSSFTEDINQLDGLVLEMGGLVEQQIQKATMALQREDRVLAKQVLKGDGRINNLEAELNESAIRILALRQPVAIDLRNVVMNLKIARHLERMGDYAKNIARRTNTITKAEAFTGSIGTLVRMSEKVQAMLKSVLDAYSHRDAQTAEAVRAEDENVDQMLNTLFRELLTYMMEDAKNISGAMHLLFIAKNIERMGDHVADIAKETMYMVTGEWPEGKRNKEDKTSKMIVDPEDMAKD